MASTEKLVSLDSLDSSDNLELPDNLFVLKNVDNTEDIFKQLKNLKPVYLDSIQKRRLVASCPGLNKFPGVKWITHDWGVGFVSKQKQLKGFTPIIVRVWGTDYGALLLILLDKEQTPVSYLTIAGGECDGSALCDKVESGIKNNEIIRNRVSYKSDPDENMLITVDSISDISKILPSGLIETKRIDSSRYRRTFKP